MLPDDDIVHDDNLVRNEIDDLCIVTPPYNWLPADQFFNAAQEEARERRRELRLAAIRLLREHGYSDAQIDNVLLILKLKP